jgi:hypothetical protein
MKSSGTHLDLRLTVGRLVDLDLLVRRHDVILGGNGDGHKTSAIRGSASGTLRSRG